MLGRELIAANEKSLVAFGEFGLDYDKIPSVSSLKR
jgi:Tat protein secretion system quality control protein TatD with DNase activity